MIVFFVHEMNQRPALRLLRTAKGQIPAIRLVTYQQAFRHLKFPVGTLIFSDFEFLNGFEMMAAAEMANAALAVNPDTRILNHPAQACERFALLRKLWNAQLNPVEVTRLEDGSRPSRYPLFLRLEDGCWGPESGILRNAEEFEQALADLRKAGRPLKRRIAVSFEAEQDADGYYRKYGSFRIGDAIIPQHILRNKGWSVKSGQGTTAPSFVAEELAFVRDNPHADFLRYVTDLGGLQFGRVDYGLVAGQPVVFEINPNPTFPRFRGGSADRQARRDIILPQLKSAFAAIDSGDTTSGWVSFTPHPHARRQMQAQRWGMFQQGLWRLRLYLRERNRPANTTRKQ